MFYVGFEEHSTSGGSGGGSGGTTEFASSVPSNVSSTGTTPITAGSIYLKQGPRILSALLGCANASHIATLKVYRNDTAALVTTVGGIASGLTDRSSSFNAPVTGLYDLTLESNNAQGTALLRSLRWS